jgi:hypothetical protein
MRSQYTSDTGQGQDCHGARARTTWYPSAETTFSQHLQKPQGSATFGEDRERRLRAAGTEPKDKQEFASLRDNDLNTARTPVVGRSLMAFKLKTHICKYLPLPRPVFEMVFSAPNQSITKERIPAKTNSKEST